MKGENIFNSEYKKLNPPQKKAVDSIDGPVMVIAGPGTGKTQILTLRIANILLKTDIPPEAILALTFTEKAAFNMRVRLSEMIGQTAYRVKISTFHSFANEIIRNYPDRFPRMIGGSNIQEADQLGIIESIIDCEDIKLLKPAGRPEAYVKTILGSIGDLKGKAIEFKALQDLINEENIRLSAEDIYDDKGNPRAKFKAQIRDIEKQKELLYIWKKYEEELLRSNRYDFADMLIEVVRALREDRELRADLREKYFYFLIDEHQDTNRSQNLIVQLIAGEDDKPNIFVVGDMEQAIFRFQGASPENFRDFSKTYPGAQIIRLDENYRSTQKILDAALGISPGQGKLTAKSGHDDAPVKIFAFSSPTIQEWAVAKMIKELVEAGEKPSEIAVLYRTNAEAEPILAHLEKMGIRCSIRGDQEVLGDITIRKLLSIISASAFMPDARELLQALHVDILGLSPIDASKIALYSRLNKISAWDVMRTKSILSELNLENPSRVSAVYSLLSDISRLIHNTSAPYALSEIVRKTNIIPYISKLPDGDRVLSKLHSLFDLARSQMETAKAVKLIDFLNVLKRLETHNSDLKAEFGGLEDAVQLITAHRAKGMEFNHVFIINSAQGHWDGSRHGIKIKLPEKMTGLAEDIYDSFDDDSDEDARRLFYVALTRARKQAIITWPLKKSDGKDNLPSAFVLTIPDEMKQQADASIYEKAYIKERNGRFSESVKKPPLRHSEYLNEVFEKNGLTVTALNNYIQCPWKYYFVNLIRIPEAPSLMGEYGSATHFALKSFFEEKNGKKDVEYILNQFETRLKKSALPESDINKMITEGRTALKGWFNTWNGKWPVYSQNEKSIDGVVLAGGLKLSGKLDKIEFTGHWDGISKTAVNVVDYKTKEPMSRNQIMGSTKNSTGNEWRQLLFYRLLLDRWQAGVLKMETGEIDFLEPNTSGLYKKERFEIPPAIVKELEEKILTVADEIRGLKFWDVFCDERNCRYCELRKMMC